MANSGFDVRIDLRISEEDKDNFIHLCSKYDRPWPDMLREIIVAFNNRKLTISVPKTKINLMKGVHRAN